MKHTSRVRSPTNSIMGLFFSRKTDVTFLNHKDEYYKHYYFPENLCNGIKIVAEIERTTLRNAVVQLMKAGFSSYMGDKVTQQIELDNAARERDEKAQRTPFAFILRKYARAKGLDISKFI
jgi:hypothetical protein